MWNSKMERKYSKINFYGGNEFIELGSGSVLSGLVKRIDKESNSYALEKIEDIENFVKNSIN